MDFQRVDRIAVPGSFRAASDDDDQAEPTRLAALPTPSRIDMTPTPGRSYAEQLLRRRHSEHLDPGRRAARAALASGMFDDRQRAEYEQLANANLVARLGFEPSTRELRQNDRVREAHQESRRYAHERMLSSFDQQTRQLNERRPFTAPRVDMADATRHEEWRRKHVIATGPAEIDNGVPRVGAWGVPPLLGR